MKIKVDENIPFRLVAALRDMRHDGHTVAEEGPTSRPDAEIWSAARREGRLLITQDLDFSDIRQCQRGTHPGVLVVRLREPGAVAPWTNWTVPTAKRRRSCRAGRRI